VAVKAHGHQQPATAAVEVLLNKPQLLAATSAIADLGCVPRYEGAMRKFRDTIRDVDVDILVSGEFPGDGRPQPVAFPRIVAKLEKRTAFSDAEPSVPVQIGGLHVVDLVELLELKLASGISSADGTADLEDVRGLIRANKLPREFVEELNCSVREKFVQLWDAMYPLRKPLLREAPPPPLRTAASRSTLCF